MFEQFKEMWRKFKGLPGLHLELKTLLPSNEQRNKLLADFRYINKNVECPHNESHILASVTAVLRLPQDI